MRYGKILALGLSVGVAVAAISFLVARYAALGPLERYYGTGPIKAIRDATSVHVWRLRELVSNKDRAAVHLDRVVLGSYERMGQGVLPSADWSKRFKRLFLDPNNHTLERLKACAPEWGVYVELDGPSGKARMPICFKCDLIDVYAHGRTQSGWEEFGPMYGQMAELMLELFPNDPEIRKLRTH